MKESKFIELLNLYVDGQLDPAEAESLETEIQRDPARRRVYGEYCRMQKACTVLAQNYLAEGAPEENAKVIAMPRQSRTWAPVFYAGGLAAAACVAFLVVTRVNHTSGLPLTAPVTTVQPAATNPQMATMTMPERAKPALVPVGMINSPKNQVASFIPTGLKLSNNFSVQQPVMAANNDSSVFAWMNTVKLSPLNAPLTEEPVFESRALQEDNKRVFRIERPVMTPIENIGFQFQK